ncbi:MBL fold metallo-hydrolase [Algoriphagus sp. CAU 1675]|uniref:MBL fold metallo-hydrolase n=1 Tax=Algoriphagus sp. CAU 1675 TaxID=3032597 RepID=UPI0023DCAEB7|nr:MBL fold metallo-hydrolase [Algoriphagus sp. CAU 1675]MDF2157965.1 MBL fold metallo-hydrolase [Algoriphagus sp. CAU 1675]
MYKLFVKLFRITIWTVVSLISLFLVAGIMFVNFSPQFGKEPSAEEKAQFEKTGHFEDGKFQNLIPTSMDMDFWKAIKLFPKFFKNNPSTRPDFEIPVVKVDSLELVKAQEPARLVWFGHSAFLLQMDGKNILLDPMFGEVPAPHPLLGKKRFSKELPIEVEKLPEIDLVIFSHDHYDHLDYESVQKLKGKTKKFFVPLGVGSHLSHWGVAEEKIQELDWWQEISYENLLLAFTPSRHFSGRGMTNRFSTLWGSWVIKGSQENIYFSGDSGYGPHFNEIGKKYGPFNFAMLECGQYNENWKEIHMMPEETAQAGVDLGAKIIMPIHWGAFSLAMHSWTDPVERVLVKAEQLQIPVFIPKIGEYIEIKEEMSITEQWWIKP